MIKKWLVYSDYDKRTAKYLIELKRVVQGIFELSESMGEELPKDFSIGKADLIGGLRRLLGHKLKLEKADKFRKRLLDRIDEFAPCLDYMEICAHNNLAERALRDNVIMRKITFGNRSDEGIKNAEALS